MPIQSCTPWPTPTVSRPGNMCSTAAASIAVSVTFRSGAGITPIASRSRLVQASIAAAMVSEPPQKQSSQGHSSARPASSAARATSGSRSGGTCGRHVAPSTVIPSSCRARAGPGPGPHRPRRGRDSARRGRERGAPARRRWRARYPG